jgi:hypothetical protein
VGGYGRWLSDTGELVQLQRPDLSPPDEPGFIPYVLVDEVDYLAEAPWPVEPAGGGDSLSRAEALAWGHEVGSWQPAAPTPGTASFAAEAEVVGRHVFYNDSAFDGGDAAAGAEDDAAIAPDKQALLPGQTAAFANYTSYINGINGVMVDVAGLPAGAGPGADDFVFRVGNTADADAWAAAPAPSSITVRAGAGIGGSDRVTLIWPNGTIQGQWLQVTMLSTAATGLSEPDVFYFGNAVGESGNSAVDAIVNAQDMLAARDNPRSFLNPAPIDFAYDYDRDARVNATDILIARDHPTHFLNALKLLNIPAGQPAAEASARDAVFGQLFTY